jgi:hypothetical protein
MRLEYPTAPIKRVVQKWAVQERKRLGGRLRAHPEIVLEFLSGRRNFITNVYLYHKARDEEPYREWVATTNGVGRLILALETILDEWARLK